MSPHSLSRLLQGELADKKARLDIASMGAAELEAIKAEHSATLAQLKERHREEMYMLQARILFLLASTTTHTSRVLSAAL